MTHARFARGLALPAALAFSAAAGASTIHVEIGGAHPTIASGVAAAAAGDVVKIEAGTYTENVLVPPSLAGLELVAHGKVVLDARAPGGAANGPGIDVKADGVTIRGLTIRNAAISDPNTPGDGVKVDANGFTAIDVTTLRCNTNAIEITGDDVLLDGCTAFGCDTGFRLDGGAHAVIRNCTLKAINGAGVVINAFDDAAVEDCRFLLIESNGVAATDPADSAIQVRRDRFENTSDFAIAIGGANAVVEDNVLIDCDAGILVEGAGFAVRNNQLRRMADFVGIDVLASTSGTVEANEIRDFGDAGIAIGSDSTNTIVQDNVIRGGLDDDSAAIQVAGGNVTVQQNQVDDCAGDGILVSGDSSFIVDNTIEDCARDGIDVDSTAAASTISANVVRRCLAEGLDHDGTVSIVTDNTFADCRIDLANSGTFLQFSGNTFATGGQNTDPEID